jgi:hypothetical protein
MRRLEPLVEWPGKQADLEIGCDKPATVKGRKLQIACANNGL